MTEYASACNPDVLRWARTTAGLSLGDVAVYLKKKEEVIASWETGETSPTYLQLEKLAYSLYKRPLALFFFPEPPEEVDVKGSFRTLPSFGNLLFPDTVVAMRKALAMQMSIYELTGGVNEGDRLIFKDVLVEYDSNIDSVASLVRNYLGITLEEQISWRDSDSALKNWRACIENVGVFIFKRSFKQEDVSGFCLYDDVFPLIYLNNSTAKTRQIFTIFHELAHILLHENGITMDSSTDLNHLNGDAGKIEYFCNRFAAEFLVPSDDFEKSIGDFTGEDWLSEMARQYSVSREVVLRKCLDAGVVDQNYYNTLKREWRKEKKGGGGGGNYYYTQAAYLGDKYAKIVFSNYYMGRISTAQAAEYLGVKASNFSKLEVVMAGRL